MRKTAILLLVCLLSVSYSCTQKQKEEQVDADNKVDKYQELLDTYVEVPLTADLSHLSDNQRKMIPILIETSTIMDDLFWKEAYGDKEELLAKAGDENLKQYIEINYGPWDRLNDNKPFMDGIGEKPLGANFYPRDITKEEFEAAELEDGNSLYTIIQRDEDGKLTSVPYHEKFAEEVNRAAQLLEEAAALAEDEGFKQYLMLRAEALRTDEYFESDMAWMDMKSNMIDFVVGPIENYEDKLYNYKAAHEAYVLIKDMEWSARLEHYAGLLPMMQENIPVDPKYKQEKPGSNADLNAYDVIYYAGDCNAGSKTIAINLPNDEEVQLAKGSRRLQLKNSMKAKFDQILVPIAEVLIDESQQKHITFDAFFANTMFHEVAHGLGIKNTINDKGTVRRALKEHFSAIEEGKADILGIYLVSELIKMGELEGDIEDFYVTFMAGIFRSVRFGAASAHGKANMIRFNFFKEHGAFSFDQTTETYKIEIEKMGEAIASLSEEILILQGNGDYQAAADMVNNVGIVTPDLRKDLDKLSAANIPIDIVFKQGTSVLGL